MMWHQSLTMLAAASVMAMGGVGAAAADPLAGTRWRERVLLVLSDRADDPRLAQQRAIFARMGRDAGDRDLRLVVVAGASPQAATLRQRFDLPATGFDALLVGKDGGAKLRSDQPLAAETLLPTIDAMPMRQDEMRRRS